jgi:hypothetical protein
VSHVQTFCNKGFAIADCRPQAPSCRAQSYGPLTRRWLLGQTKKISTFSEIALNHNRATASVKALCRHCDCGGFHRNSAAQSIGTEFGNCRFRLTKLHRFVCIVRPRLGGLFSFRGHAASVTWAAGYHRAFDCTLHLESNNESAARNCSPAGSAF